MIRRLRLQIRFFMESILLLAVVMLELSTAFHSGMYYAFSADEFKAWEKIEPEDADFVKAEKREFHDAKNPFLTVEIFLFLIIGFLCMMNILGLVIKYNSRDMVYISFSAVILPFLRWLFYSLGMRRQKNPRLKNLRILKTYIRIYVPFERIFYKIFCKITNRREGEDSLHELSVLVDSVYENAQEEDPDSLPDVNMLRNVLKFGDVTVSDIMTPRTVVFSASSDATVGDIFEIPEVKMYSRFPVHDGEDLDDGVVGYVMSKDVFLAVINGQKDKKLRELARKINYIPENSGLDTTLDTFLKTKQMLMLVVDEYGGVEGLISLEDIIETVLGAEIVDEADKVADLRELAKQRRDRRIKNKISGTGANE